MITLDKKWQLKLSKVISLQLQYCKPQCLKKKRENKRHRERQEDRQTDIRKVFVIELSGVDNGEMRLESNGGNGWR